MKCCIDCKRLISGINLCFSFRSMLLYLYFSGFFLGFLVFSFRYRCFVPSFKSIDVGLVLLFCLFIVYYMLFFIFGLFISLCLIL
ncbi:hypothetical protein E1A91_D11G000300v1 [Gossypium mustelinum]|uniref:Uncharacterized protein n=1 Tax=Gossypium mustelinum TaxID=34275 RepID=A0A5D2SN82_GOSMU|nr:hypothetical protein E1A91_D11G000300v1 [Gossypium mustelinum]